jgi:hypothetical protein
MLVGVSCSILRRTTSRSMLNARQPSVQWRIAAKTIGEDFGAHAFLPAFHTVYPQLFEGLVLRLPGVVFSHANFLMPRENHLRLAPSEKMSNYL